MRYLGMCGVIIVLVIVNVIISEFMGWKHGGGAIRASLYGLFSSSVFMLVFSKKDSEKYQRNLKIHKYIALISGIVFLILCYYSIGEKDKYRNITGVDIIIRDHPDFIFLDEEKRNILMADMKKWIETKPYTEGKQLLDIHERGNAEQVSWLLSEYKKYNRVATPKIDLALPFSGRSRVLGERVKQNKFWYSYVLRSNKENIFCCETNAIFFDDNLPIRLLVIPQVFLAGDVFYMFIPKSKIDINIKSGVSFIVFDDGTKINTLYSVDNCKSQDDSCYIAIEYYNAKSIINLMMKYESINIKLDGQNVSTNFSLIGFTASFKRLLALSQGNPPIFRSGSK